MSEIHQPGKTNSNRVVPTSKFQNARSNNKYWDGASELICSLGHTSILDISEILNVRESYHPYDQ